MRPRVPRGIVQWRATPPAACREGGGDRGLRRSDRRGGAGGRRRSGIRLQRRGAGAMMDQTETRRRGLGLHLGSGPGAAAYEELVRRAVNERWAERLHARDVTLWSSD